MKKSFKKWLLVFVALMILCVCLPAIALAEEEGTLKVTYNINGGTGTVPVDENLYKSGDKFMVLPGKDLTRENYYFRGWRTGATSGNQRDAGKSFTITANTTLYAWWQATTGTPANVIDWSAPRLDRAAFMTEVGWQTQIGLINAAGATWRSNNTTVAAVSQTGLVTATGNGEATITATIDGTNLTCIVTVGYKGQNPPIPQSWQLYIPDGEPHVFNDVMYVYGSRDITGGSCSNRYNALWTEDGIHWTDGGISFTTADLPEPYRRWTSYLWAPDCVYHPLTGKYYLFTCSTDAEGEFYVAESTSPRGPFVNARQITYKNGPADGQRIGNIDPGVLVDDDGTFWISFPGLDGQQRTYNNSYGPSRTRYGIFDVATATVDTNTIIDVHDLMLQGNTMPFEGPSLRKFGDYYYFIYVSDYKVAERPTGVGLRADVQPSMLDYIYTKDIRDPNSWKYGGTFLNASYFPTIVNTHGSMTKFGDEYYVVYHNPMAAGQRRTRIEHVNINPETGIISPVTLTSTGFRTAFDMGERINAFTAVDFSTGRWAATPFGVETVDGYSKMFFYLTTAGQYAGYRYVDFGETGAQAVNFRVRTTGADAKLLVYSDKPGTDSAKLLAELDVPNTGSVWQEIGVQLAADNGVTGVKPVYIMLQAAPGAGRVEIDWFQFTTGILRVTYNLNGGEGVVPVDGKLYASGDKFTALPGKDMTRENYFFRGWRTGATSGNQRDAGKSFTITANTTLYAWWQATTGTPANVIDWSAPRLDRAAFMTEVGWQTQIGIINADIVVWSSSNTAVATVSQTGLVTATGNGEATIMASINETTNLTCIVTVGYKGQNPPIPQSWQLYIPDGEPHVFNGVMYVYGSRDITGGSCSNRYNALWTEDGIHWTDGGVSFTTADLPEPYRRWTTVLWAPDCVYYPPTEKYYLFTCSSDTEGEFYVAESNSPRGPFVNARNIKYKNGPADGQRVGNIDPGVLVDDDNTLWISFPGLDGQQRTYYNSFGPSRTRYGIFDVETATVDTKTIIDVHDLMLQGNTMPFEGPSLRKFGDYYYFIYVSDYKVAERPTGVGLRADVQPSMLDYMYTKDIRDPNSWTYGGTFLNASYFPTIVNTHGSVTKFGDEYYVVYHNPMAAGQRRMRMEQVDIDPDTGIITPVTLTSSGFRTAFDMGERINGFTAVDFSNGRWAATPFGIETVDGYSKMFFYLTTAGQYAGYRYVDFGSDGAQAVNFRVRTTGADGKLLLYSDKPGTESAKLLTEFDVPNTESAWQEIDVQIAAANRITGVSAVYIVLQAAPSAGRIELDWFQFNGEETKLNIKSLLPPNTKLLEKYAANIPVNVTPEGFVPESSIIVTLKGTDGTVYGTATVDGGGYALIRASAFPEAGTYTLTAVCGDVTGVLELDVSVLDIGIWSAIALPADGSENTLIRFGDTPEPRFGSFDGCVTINNDTPLTGTSVVGNAILIPYKYSDLKTGDVIVIKDVTYPLLFPSFSFTFTVKI